MPDPVMRVVGPVARTSLERWIACHERENDWHFMNILYFIFSNCSVSVSHTLSCVALLTFCVVSRFYLSKKSTFPLLY